MSWRKVRLGDFLKVRKDRFKPNDKAIQGLKRIDKIDFSGNIYLSEKPSKTDMILVKKGDLVISGINVEKGAMSVYQGDEDVIATIHYSSYEFDTGKIDIDFLKYFLKSSEFKEALKEQVPGGIKTEIKPKHLLPLEVEIPIKIADQKKLVQNLNIQFSQIDNLFSEQSHQLDLIKKLRQQILKDAMQGKLVPQNPKDEPASKLLEKIKAEKTKSGKKEKPLPEIKPEEIPFEIPENWVWCRLGEICTKITDGFHNTPPKASEGIPYIAATQVKSDKIDWENCNYVEEKYHRELYTKAYPQKGELLVVNIGAGCGTPAIIDVDFEFSFKNTAILKFNQSLISNKLLFYYFLLRKEEIYAELTKGGLQPFLSLKILNEINFPLPPIAEQKRIVCKIEELMTLCDELEASVKANLEYSTLLYQTALKEALQPKTVEAKQENFAIAAETQATYFSQKNLLDFYQKQIIGHIVKQHNEHKMQQGEMVIAKDLYHLEKLYGIKTHFQFQNWHFGTYDNKIRQLINGKDKYFKKEIVGNKGYEVLALGDKSENLFNPKYHKPELDLVVQSMKDLLKIYSTFPIKERSKRIELLNTVSKVISDTQSLDIATIREAMKQWKTPKAKFPTKADTFTLEETKECIDLILKQGWDKKLIH